MGPKVGLVIMSRLGTRHLNTADKSLERDSDLGLTCLDTLSPQDLSICPALAATELEKIFDKSKAV